MRERTTHNIKQLRFSGLRAFDSRFNFFLGGYRRSPKTQPFHIVNRYAPCNVSKIHRTSKVLVMKTVNQYKISSAVLVFAMLVLVSCHALYVG